MKRSKHTTPQFLRGKPLQIEEEKPQDLCPPKKKLFTSQQEMSTRESPNIKYDDTTAQEV